MQLVDRIEKRRFVGREFLLWLWFVSERDEATFQTKQHGSFALFLEKKLVLSEGKESTRITAPFPGQGREAKEALRKGQLPESAGIHITYGDQDITFVFKGEQLAISGLKLQTVLGQEEEEAPTELMKELMPAPRGKKRRKTEEERNDEAYEAFYERMRLTQEFEGLIEALYREFLGLRLSKRWARVVEEMRSWTLGVEARAAE